MLDGSFAGPSHLYRASSSPTPVAFATPASIRNIGAETLSIIEDILKKQKSSTAEALTATLQSCLARLHTSLEHHQESDELIQGDLALVATTLQEVRSALKARAAIRKRDRLKASISKFFGMNTSTKGPDPYVAWRIQVEDAFQALDLKITKAHRTTTIDTAAEGPQQSHSGNSAPIEGAPAPRKSGSGEGWHTAIDVVEKALQSTSAVADVIPAPAGTIVKVVTAVGLSIVTMLKDVASNNEEAVDLAQHLGELVRTIVQFVGDAERKIRSVTLAQLESFQAELEEIEKELRDLNSQGTIKKAISHARNKDVLAGCDTQIRRAFVQLQVYLSLDATRLLTGLEDADARQEADRLLDLLGDLDTGARDKADDPDDLVCLPGTRVELLEDVHRWIAKVDSQRVLWINGVAGCGKSAVAATIASQKNGPSASAIFHFSRGNQGRNDRVICCLARQLARWNHGSLKHLVLAAVQKNPDIASSHFATQFQNLIVEPLKKMVVGTPPVLIVIDALDEWDKQDSAARLVDLIRRWDGDLPGSVKIVLTSRKESHLNTAFDDPRINDLVLRYALDSDTSLQHANRDIKAYLKKRFTDIQLSSREPLGPNWPGTGALQDFVKFSGGLFQWASTAVAYVKEPRHQARLEDIRAHPNELGDLDQLYQHILRSLFHNRTRPTTLDLLQDVLGLIVIAPIPTTLNTIVFLLVDHKESTLDKLEEVRDEILGMLGAFLIIPTDPDQPIRVLHPSITDYLTDPQRCTDLRFYIERIPHNQNTSVLCFQRMRRDLKRNICGTNDPAKVNAEIQDAVSEHVSEPLRYVCRYWAHHLSASGKVPTPELVELVGHFCHELVLFWIEVMVLTGTVHQAVASIRTAEEWAHITSLDLITHHVRKLVLDTRRFLLAYSEPISTNAQHIYISALSCTPSETLFSRTYQTSATSPRLRILLGPVDIHWPTGLWVAARHSGAVARVAFSSDDKTIVSCSRDKTLRLWDVETGMQKGEALEGHSDQVTCVAYSSDGKTVVSGSSDNTLCLWDVEVGMQRGHTLKGHSSLVHCVAFSSDGKMVVSGSRDKTVRLWDVETGVQRGDALEGHSGDVNCVAFSSNNMMVVSGSSDMTLRMWDAKTGTQRGGALKGHSRSVHCLALSSDGKIIVSGSFDSTLRLWDVEARVQKGPALRGHSSWVSCVAFSSDDKTVVSGSGDASLRLWDVGTGMQKGDSLKGHLGGVGCLAVSSDDKTVVSGSLDKTLRLWDVETGTQRGDALEGHSHQVHSVAFSSDGKTVVSGSEDATVRLWDIKGAIRREEAVEGHSDQVRCLEFSRDGKIVVSGSEDTTLRMWDTETGKPKGDSLEGHSSGVDYVRFSSDGKTIVSGSDDQTLYLWDVETGKPRRDVLMSLSEVETEMQSEDSLDGEPDAMTCTALSADGKTLVSGGFNGSLHLWDVEMGRRRSGALKGHSGRVNCLEFSSDGKMVLSGSSDASFCLWDVETGMQMGDSMTGHSSGVTCVAFSSDHKTIVSGADDETVRAWDVETGTQKGAPLHTGLRVTSLALSSANQYLEVAGTRLENAEYQQWDLATRRRSTAGQATSNSVQGATIGLVPVELQLSPDGWVHRKDQRWFWLPVSFGRDITGSLLGERFIFSYNRYVCIIDVSQIMYIVN